MLKLFNKMLLPYIIEKILESLSNMSSLNTYSFAKYLSQSYGKKRHGCTTPHCTVAATLDMSKSFDTRKMQKLTPTAISNTTNNEA